MICRFRSPRNAYGTELTPISACVSILIRRRELNVYDLPRALAVNGKIYDINADFRVCIDILIMLESAAADERKALFMLEKLYVSAAELPLDAAGDAIRAVCAFLDGGADPRNSAPAKPPRRLFRWEKDAALIFAGIDKVLGRSCRRMKFLHWWEFLGAFREIGGCTFSRVLYLRSAFMHGRMTDEERRIWNENPRLYRLETEDDLRGEREFLKNFNAF
jgi:hypothetical protein